MSTAALNDPIAWAERIAGLTLDPWQRDVLLSAAPRLLLNATRQSGKSTAAALDETARDRKFADVVDCRYAMPPSERDERVALTVEKRIALDDESASQLIAKSREGPREVGCVPRLQHDETPPERLRRSADLLRISSALGLSGLTRRATRFAPGTISRITSRRLLPRALVIRLIPVALPWGWLKLATSPARTGSSAIMKTIGVAPAAAFAAAADGSPPVTRTDTGRRASSAANAPRRSLRPPAQRYSTWTLRSSAYPARSRPRRKAAL